MATRLPGEETDRIRLGVASSAIFSFSAWLIGACDISTDLREVGVALVLEDTAPVITFAEEEGDKASGGVHGNDVDALVLVLIIDCAGREDAVLLLLPMLLLLPFLGCTASAIELRFLLEIAGRDLKCILSIEAEDGDDDDVLATIRSWRIFRMASSFAFSKTGRFLYTKVPKSTSSNETSL